MTERLEYIMETLLYIVAIISLVVLGIVSVFWGYSFISSFITCVKGFPIISLAE